MPRKKIAPSAHPHISEDHPTPEGPVSTAAAIDSRTNEHDNDVERAFADSEASTQSNGKSKFSLLR